MTIAAEPFARVWAVMCNLTDGSLGYRVVERHVKGRESRVVREFTVDWSKLADERRAEGRLLEKGGNAGREAEAFARAYNAEHHSRVGQLVTANGYRDFDMKLHYVTADDGSDHVTVACGKSVINRDGGRTIEDAAENELLGTWGVYRCCKKCWRSPVMKAEVARVCPPA